MVMNNFDQRFSLYFFHLLVSILVFVVVVVASLVVIYFAEIRLNQ